MKKIYLVPLTENQLPVNLSGVSYVHVKMNNADQLGIIISKEILPFQIKTQAQAQDLLDAWINQENNFPEIDSNGNPCLQSKINIGAFL